MITNERAELFAAYLKDHKDRVPELLDLEPAEVQAIVNADGYDFTVEEIASVGDAVQAALKNAPEGELTEEALEDVAGGSILALVVTAVVLDLTVMGIGIAQTKKSKIKW